MASTDATPVVTMTAACELGTHRCKGVVLSLTDAHLSDCACSCHDGADVEEDDGADVHADLLLEMHLEDIHFAEGWS